MLAPPLVRTVAWRPVPTWRLAPGVGCDAGAIVLLGAYAAVLLRATLVRGGAMLGFDLFNYFYPGKVFAAESLRRGELPVWNPDIFFGAPFLANIQMAVLYPPNLVFAAADFPRGVALSLWLHLTIAATGMYFLCRRGWVLQLMPSMAGALAFAGGGFFAAHMGHLNQVHASAWLPWLVYSHAALARAIAGRPWPWQPQHLLLIARPTFAGGIVVALLLTAGHTQEAYLSLVALGLLSASFTLWPPAWAPGRWSHLPALALMTGNGALVAAAQLLPTLELSGLSYRQGGIPLEDAVAFGVERTYLLESLLPTFWHLPGQEVTGYVGTGALLLAIGVLASPARRTVVALAGLALLAVVLTLGTYTPLFALLHAWVPLFDSFRAPGRWLLISSFALAGLAAHGLSALSHRVMPPARERVVRIYSLGLAFVAAATMLFAWRSEVVHAIHWLPHARVAVLWLGAALGTAALCVAGATTRSRVPSLLVIAALALELVYAAREMEYNQPGAPRLYSEPPAVAEWLGRAASAADPPPRTLSLAVEERLDPDRLRRAVPSTDREYQRYAAMKEVLRPNLGVTYGLPTPDGYDGGLLPLKSYADFKALLVTDEPPVPHYTLAPQAPARPNARLFGALNVRFLLLDGRAGSAGSGWDAREPAPGAAWLYENTGVLPRAYVVEDVRVEPDPRRAIALLQSMDLGTSAVVERPVAGLQLTDNSSLAPARPARILRYGATELLLEADGPGLLVATETFYPGWRATVDGASSPLVRTDVHFRGIPLSPGRHQVRMWFDPLSIKVGFAVSGLALLANVLVLGYGWSARPRHS